MKLSEKKKKAGLLALVVLLFTAVTFIVWPPLVGMVSDPEKFRAWVTAKGLAGKLIFVGMTALQTIFAVIPGEPFEIGAGFAFGTFQGLLLSLCGLLAGSAAVFIMVKRFGEGFAELFISREKLHGLRAINDRGKISAVIFILFLIPGTPKDVLTYFVPFTNIRLRAFLFISAIARIPSVISSTMAGNSLGEKNYAFAAAVFAVTALISILGLVIYNNYMQKEKDRSK